MSRVDSRPSYVVLRLDCGAAEWVEAASARRRAAPDAIRALLAGRSRVEITEAEAKIALQWAAELPGWDEDQRPPLFVHAPAASLIYR